MSRLGVSFVAFVLGCSATVERTPQPAPPPAEVSPPEVEPREGEAVVGDQAEATGGGRKPCDQITDWHECQEASHCAPTHEEPVDPNGPSFSCLPD